MSTRLIPSADPVFEAQARQFAREVATDPARFAVSPEDADAMTRAAARFTDSLHKISTGGERSRASTRDKDDARADAAKLYKRMVNRIRANVELDAAALISLGLPVPASHRRARPVPQTPPYLRFVQALHIGTGAAPMHELSFSAEFGSSQSKPPGATRLELFVDLIVPDEPVPPYPGANFGGRPWYLRSYSRSPIKLTPPIARVPMLVLYWGRWADATGNVGPFSNTIVSRVEGWSPHTMVPESRSRKQTPILEEATTPGPAERPQRYSVAVLDARQQSFAPQRLGAPRESQPRRLEGPPVSEAA